MHRSRASTRSSDKFAEPMSNDEMNKLLDEQAKLQDAIDRSAAGSSNANSRSPPTRCACRRGMPSHQRCPAASGAAWRCAGCCCRSPTCCCSTSRRTISTPSPCLARALSRGYPGTVIAVTHDRYFLDNVAGWILELDRGHGIPWQGNYSSWLEQKDARLAARGKATRTRCASRCRRNSSGCARTPRRAAPRARRACSATKSSHRRNSRSATRPTRSTFRPARDSATSSSRSKDLRKAFGDRLLIDNLTSACPRAASSASSAPMAPARRPCSA